jgi:putative transposase
VEHLRQPGTKAAWKSIKTDLLHHLPDWADEIPYQIKSIAIRDACLAVSAAKRKFKQNGLIQRVSFRSRRMPQQGVFIPSSAVSSDGVYKTILGRLKSAEPIPADPKDSRLVLVNGRYYLCVPTKVIVRQGENQARIVSLDPGIRSFLTWFSQHDAGKLGVGSFGRIQRLCWHLDNLISKRTQVKGKRKRRLKLAENRMRHRIRDLIDELHWKSARWLVDNYDIILLPSFETSQMACAGKLRSKSVRMLMSFAHYRFQNRLVGKAFEAGKRVEIVNEAYTSKTASWTGEIKAIGSARTICSGGVRVDRDINGARGIFLRALRDSASLRTAFVNQ